MQSNNNYATTSAFPNPYISRRLNNIKEAQMMKKEREDWMRLYHKILKGLETIIDIQRMVKDMKKIAEEVNMMITEIEDIILIVSINNRTMNVTNISEISKDL